MNTACFRLSTESEKIERSKKSKRLPKTRVELRSTRGSTLIPVLEYRFGQDRGFQTR